MDPHASTAQGLDLNEQAHHEYGRHHRSGWRYAVQQLLPLHREGGVYLESFIERRFGWAAADHGEASPITRPWLGFVHVPPDSPPWFVPEVTPGRIFASRAWRESLPHCRGLFTLSRYHQRWLADQLAPLPVRALVYPAEPPTLRFSWSRFCANPRPRLIQVGWWLRVLHAIATLPRVPYVRTFMPGIEGPMLRALMQHERARWADAASLDDAMARVEHLGWVDHATFDRLLAENLVFLKLYDASASNTVIECMVRHTPIVVNRLAAVVEYLGPDYPLYYDDDQEAAAKLVDLERVRAAHEHLRASPMLAALRGEAFRDSLVRSDLYPQG